MVRGRKKERINVEDAKEEEVEDRISNLSDDLIHLILSIHPIDPKYAVQTSIFSTRWRHAWKSLSHLNFERSSFTSTSRFSNFVLKFLNNRNNNSDLITFNLTCPSSCGEIQRSLVQKIALYAASHNVQNINISSDVSATGLPSCIFTNQSSKNLCLSSSLRDSIAPKSSWLLPALTTLFLQGVPFQSHCNFSIACKSIDLFSGLLNLKDLSLIDCNIKGFKIFHIASPQLEYLAITNKYWKFLSELVFVLLAPQLSSFVFKVMNRCRYLEMISIAWIKYVSIFILVICFPIQNITNRLSLICSIYSAMCDVSYPYTADC